jgi:hypothetical protein
LNFFDRKKDYFKVELSGSDINGVALVYSFEPRASSLVSFFHDLAINWRGWRGKKEWRSLEGELAVTATSDSTGHISILVRLRSGPYPFEWRLEAMMLVEAGQLGKISSSIQKFFETDQVD